MSFPDTAFLNIIGLWKKFPDPCRQTGQEAHTQKISLGVRRKLCDSSLNFNALLQYTWPISTSSGCVILWSEPCMRLGGNATIETGKCRDAMML